MAFEIPEKLYEDLIFADTEIIRDFVSHSLQCSYDGAMKWSRQVRTSAGIADLVIVHEYGFTVVELKAQIVDEAAVAQVLRYMGAIRCATHFDDGEMTKIKGIVAAPELSKDGAFAILGVPDGCVFFSKIELRVACDTHGKSRVRHILKSRDMLVSTTDIDSLVKSHFDFLSEDDGSESHYDSLSTSARLEQLAGAYDNSPF